MATPIVLAGDNLYVDQSCNVLKARDYESWIDSQDIINKAQEQAEKIAEQAREMYQKEKQRGYEDGLDESKAEQAEQMLKVVSRTINYLSSIEKAMTDILFSGVKKIINDFDEEALVVGLIKNALKHVRNEKQVTIRIPPSQYNMVQARISDILENYEGVSFIELVADQRLSTGDCIMESEIGIVETSVDIQLQALKKRFERVNATTQAAFEEPSEMGS
ncbi:MAG: HrpE/YscL family type III secretion apparatus protein [Endozoicomonas sp. (ex Botrylloides leachii)]|nr:HrpE/YscL family type III secretion apparatus protein [Endozoicomonas sp. (ex Botrylloides leachii)]